MADFRILAPVVVLLALLSSASVANASHVQCGDEITADTTLDSDLTCPGNGLIVTASNVTIDLNGHTIRGSGGGDGVQVVPTQEVDPTDLRVRSGIVRGFNSGILTEAARTVVHDMVLEDNSVGFMCNYADGCDLTDSLLRRNRTGMQAQFADSSPDDHGVIARNTFLGNEIGLGLANYPSTVSDNYFVRNTGPGVVIDYGQTPQVNITRNVIEANGGEGVLVVYQGDVSISANRIARNAGAGVRIEGGGDFSGIEAHVHHNRIWRNAADGIFVGSEVVAEIEQNRTDRNGDDGIDVDPSRDCCSDVTVRTNRAFFNTDLGIEAVTGTRDGGGNRAKHNGNPAQCIGVRCG